MVPILFIYGICAFAFGSATISISILCSRYSRNVALKKFSLFFIVFSLQVFASVICGYVFNEASANAVPLKHSCFLISLFFHGFLLWATALFPLVLFRSRRSGFFGLLFLVIYAGYFILMLRGVEWQYQSNDYAVASYFSPLYMTALFATNLWSLLYSLLCYKKADSEVRELLRFILPLLSFFLPAWLADLFLPAFFTYTFSLTLYSLFGVLLLRFSIKAFRSAVFSHYAPSLSTWSADRGLSNREQEILALILQGKENGSIGSQLFISVNTVKTHVKNILRKTETTDRFSLLLKISRLEGTPPV